MRLEKKNTVQSVERAIDLLDCFSVTDYELSISDFVQKTKLNRTTVFRLLYTLEEKGLVNRNENTGTYRLGYKFVGMAQIVKENLDVRQEALPYLKRISKQTGETVSLNILRSQRRICIEKVDGTEDIRQFVQLGNPYYLVKGASGKVLLAFHSDEEIGKVLDEWETVHGQRLDRKEYFKGLQRIRERKVAVSDSDRVFGAVSISAPILDSDNNPIAGISISSLSIRLSDEKKEEYQELIKNAAKELSNKYRYSL